MLRVSVLDERYSKIHLQIWGEGRNQAVLSIFVGYALALVFAWGIFGQFNLSFKTEKLFVEPKCEGVTLSVTRCVSGNLCSSTCYRILHPKAFPYTENKLVFRFSNRRKHIVLCWQNDGRNPNLFHFFYFFFLWCFLMWTTAFAPFAFFRRCEKWLNENFPTGAQQNCKNVLRSKRMNNNLFLFIFERRNMWKYFWQNSKKKQSLHHESKHVSKMTTASSRKTRLDTIMIAPLSRWWHFRRLSTKRNFPFLKREIPFSSKDVTGKSLFSRDVYSPSIFLGPHFLLCQVSHYSLGSSSLEILSARSMIEWKYEKIEGCEQSTISQLE